MRRIFKYGKYKMEMAILEVQKGYNCLCKHFLIRSGRGRAVKASD